MRLASATPFSREKLLLAARSLPADLHVLSELGEMVQDVNSDLAAVADLLRRDAALASRIVRISNSAMFAGSGQIGSTEEAVNRVGFSEILKLVGTATAARYSEHALEFYGVPAPTLRANMLFTAFAAESLARSVGLDPRLAYTAGLLRTLGMMVLDRSCRGQASHANRYAPARWPSYSAWEGSFFGVNNCEVAALILDEWRFPRAIGRAIRSHYLEQAADADDALGRLLNLANVVAHRAGYSLGGEAAWWQENPELLLRVGASEDALAAANAYARTAFDSATAALAA